MRDVKGKHTRVHSFFRPSCVQKTRLTNESEVSDPSNRRISAHVRVVVLGVLRRVLSFGPENRLFRRRPRPSGIWQALYDPGKRCTLPLTGGVGVGSVCRGSRCPTLAPW